MSNKIETTAIILAGGKSSRMGQDKALLPFGEKTMLEHIVQIAELVCDTALVVVNLKSKTENLELGDALVCEDLIKNSGPLAGIYTGLCYSHTRANCVLTCDMPLISASLICELMRFWDASSEVICFENAAGLPEPFPGIYDRNSRHLVRLLLDRDREHASMHHFLQVVTMKSFALREEQIKFFTNLNTAQDYAGALERKEE